MESLEKPFEVILVDDGSTDMSWSLIAEIARYDRRVVAMQIGGNFGQGNATMAGLRQSVGQFVITLDDDLQHVPEEIPKLIAHLSGNYDVVFGVPLERRHPSWRRFSSWVINLLFSLMLRKSLSLRFTGFRVMRQPIVLRLVAMRWPDPFISALLFQLTTQIGVIQVEHSVSELPSTRYSIRKLARIAVGYFGAFSGRELSRLILVATGAGLGLMALALLGCYFRPAGPIAIALLLAVGVFGVLGFVLALAAAAVKWRVLAYQRKPLAPIPIQRMICEMKDVVGNL
jgi:glycosyltransferase involved in cell wall biosynthesis